MRHAALPPGATAIVIGDMLCRFLQDNPDVRGSEGNDLLMTVIASRYTCPVE